MNKNEKKLVARTFFETHMMSATDVANKFGIAPRTMFYWVKKENWVMGANMSKEKIDILEDELLKRETISSMQMAKDDIKSTQIKAFESKNVPYDEGVIESNANEMLLVAMGQDFIDKTIVEAGLTAKQVLDHFITTQGASNPKAMGLAKDLVSIWVSIKGAIHGNNSQQINIANINSASTNTEIASLSDDEIRALLKKK